MSDSSPDQDALAHVEQMLAANRADAGIAAGGSQPGPIKRVGICGAGMMGTAVAAVHIRREFEVVLTDLNAAALDAAPYRIAHEFDGILAERELQPLLAQRVTVTGDLDAAARCDLVLESIVEQLGPKLDFYRQLQPRLLDGTIVASNTSTLPIAKLAAGLADPGRFCGMHFFHPVRQRPLVEIIRGPQTSAATLATVVAHARRIGKLPIVVGDGPGFLVNRLLVPWVNEALQLLAEGVRLERIEQTALDFGMAKGPFSLLDEIGLDTVLRGGFVLYEAFPERVGASPILLGMLKRGWVGRKSGLGFFRYPAEPGENSLREENPDLGPLIARWSTPRAEPLPDDLGFRLMLPMLLEATRIIAEGLVRSPADVDLGVIFGLGFPRRRGGLLYWADSIGTARLVELAQPWAALGPRMQPPEMLLDMARRSGRFHA